MRKKKGSKSKSGDIRKKIDFNTSVAYHEVEDEKVYSSSYSDGAVVYTPKVLKQKLLIATNILVECKEEKEKLLAGKYVDPKSEPILNRLNRFTNLPMPVLTEINDSVRTRDRSFEKAFKDVKQIHYITSELLMDDIRSIFVKYIIEEKNVPSKMDILRELKITSSKYTNEMMPIQRLIQNKLIKYHHFRGLNRYLLMEHPERVYQRTVYLNNIVEYRKQGRNFIYVEVRRIAPRSTSSGFIAGLAAFPTRGVFEKFFTKDSAELIAKKWLQQRILHLLDEGSVVVLSQPKKRNKVSLNLKKTEMMSWLDEHKIPYDSDAHSAELYTLYKTFKVRFKEQGIYDHVFLNAGFEVIHCPEGWKKLNYFKEIWSQVEVMDGYHMGRPETLKQNILNATQTMSTLDKTEKTLMEDELKVLKEDIRMEETLDNVLNLVKNEEVPTLEFPKECCGDKTDYFEMHVGNIILDTWNQ